MLDPKWKSPQWPEGYWPQKKENITNEGYWPEEKADLKNGEWEKSLNGFYSDLKEVQDFVTNTNEDLTAKIPHTKNHTYLREILLIIDHNAYHLGKIIEMRKALNDW